MFGALTSQFLEETLLRPGFESKATFYFTNNNFRSKRIGTKRGRTFFIGTAKKIETFGAKNISDAKTKLFLTTLAIPKTNFCRRFDRFVSIDVEKVFLRQRVLVVDWADATERERESTSTSTSTSGCRCRCR